MYNNITEEEINIKEKFFVNQTSINDCGAACLAMIFKLNNIDISLKKIKKDLNIQNDGVSAYEIIKYANKNGLRAVGYKNVDLKKLKRPSIVHIINEDETQHFVVFIKELKNKVLVADPAKKIMYIDKKDFLSKYTKVAIIFEENQNVLYKVLENKLIILKILLVSVVLIIISIVFSSILPIIISLLEEKNNINSIHIFMLAFIFIILLKNVVSYIKQKLLISFQLSIDKIITIPILEKLIYLPQKFYYNKGSGELVSKVNDLFYIKNAIYIFVSNIIINILFLFFCLIIVLFVSKKLLFINMFLIIFIIFINKKFYNNNLSKTYDMQLSGENLNNRLTDYFQSIYLTKNSYKERYIENKIKKIYNDLLFKMEKISFIYNKKDLKDNLIFDFYYLIIILLLCLKTNNIPLILFIISIENVIIDLIKETIKQLPVYIDFKGYYVRIKEILDIKKINKDSLTININHIQIKDLNFKYNERSILKNINLKINKGDWVMINGVTGSGKSTLFKLLTKQISINKGIFINDRCINEYDYEILNNSIVYVNQKIKLFNTSIKENIFFDGNVNKKIIKICLIDRFLKEKDITLDYIVDSANSNLSGGEISKILIAQALNFNKSTIILDETTNNFDYKTEYQILNNIKNNYKDLTLILITHRNKNSSFFNKIYTLEDGKLITKKEVK